QLAVGGEVHGGSSVDDAVLLRLGEIADGALLVVEAQLAAPEEQQVVLVEQAVDGFLLRGRELLRRVEVDLHAQTPGEKGGSGRVTHRGAPLPARARARPTRPRPAVRRPRGGRP